MYKTLTHLVCALALVCTHMHIIVMCSLMKNEWDASPCNHVLTVGECRALWGNLSCLTGGLQS